MRYSFVSAAVLALVSSVFAQESTDGFDVITAPMNGQKVVAGKEFDITWVPGDKPEYQNGTATIALLQGSNSKDLHVGDTIVAGVKNSLAKYTWTVPTTAGSFAAYGLRITLDDDKSTTANEASIFQYSFPFQIVAADQAGSGVTTTIQLGTGTAYTPAPTTTSTSTHSSILVVVNSTSSITTTSVSALPTNSSNFTMTATAFTSSSRGSGASPTSARPPAQTANAGVANAVSGGFVLVGALAALLL